MFCHKFNFVQKYSCIKFVCRIYDSTIASMGFWDEKANNIVLCLCGN